MVARYLKFFESVKSSSSVVVSVVANLAAADIRSVTGSNLFNLKREAGMDKLEKLLLGLSRTKILVKISKGLAL